MKIQNSPGGQESSHHFFVYIPTSLDFLSSITVCPDTSLMFNLDNIIRKIDNRIVKRLLLFFLFSFFIVPASLRAATQTEEIIAAIIAYNQSQNLLFLKEIKEKKPLLQNSQSCRFHPVYNNNRSIYFQMECAGASYPNFIYYTHQRQSENQTNDIFQITGYTIIASRPYFIIQPYTEESFRYPEGFPSLIFNRQSTGYEVLLDAKCPLEFVGINHDFYWDQKEFFTFKITCIQNTSQSLIYIPSDAEGKILIGKKRRSDFHSGELFFARMTVSGFVNNRIKWENIIVYPN